MHSAKFHLYVEQKLKTGPTLAGLTGPTPTALLYHCCCRHFSPAAEKDVRPATVHLQAE